MKFGGDGSLMTTLYTIGYTSRSIDELAGLAKANQAGIIDIRFQAWSRHPKWRKADLAKSLAHRGVEYSHIRELGNIHYDRPGPIEIAKPDLGCQMLWEALQDHSQIILCACPDFESCHRKTVADLMARKFGVDVVHLDAKPKPTEPTEYQQELF
jgi:uncharacterized protein (DUF488 family)